KRACHSSGVRMFLMGLLRVDDREQDHGNIANAITGGVPATLTLIPLMGWEKSMWINSLTAPSRRTWPTQ
ncbi:hypothetical protein ACMV5I_23295, partial [Serratia sp. T13T92]|uniref:hypothetical protein n=1 Tax=Serratia sp. T13T92 TaxID=3397496 RepID=UPI0039DFA444